MYSSPSGSILKKGPRPKRSFAGPGRSSKTFMLCENLTYHRFVGSLVALVVRWSHRRRAVVIAMLTVALIVSIEGTRRLSFDSNVLSLLPRDSRVIQAFQAFLSRFGTLDQLYVVLSAPEGHAISEYADEIDGWTEGLRAAPEILRVDAGSADPARRVSRAPA